MLVVRSSRLQYLNIKIDVGFSTPKNKIKNQKGEREVRNFLGFFHLRPREEKKKEEREREREKRNKKRRQACAVEDQNASVT